MDKTAHPDHPIHDLLTHRWSPYAFSDKPVSREDLCALFEAARWTASSYNDQPWFYIIATRDQPEEFARVVSCLVEGNQVWAKQAAVVGLGVYRETLSRGGKPNGAAQHDLGGASCSLTVEATHRGLVVHQMIGIEPEKARQTFHIPDGYTALTGLAIGYAGDPESLPDNLKSRDTSARQRKAVSEFVFTGDWGKPAGSV